MEHSGMLPKDVPILLAYVVSAFATSNGGKFERTVDIGVSVCNVEPFPEWQEVMMFCMVV